MAVNGIALLMRNIAEVVNRFANHVHDTAQRAFAYGNRDWSSRIGGFHPAHHAVGGQHRDRAYATFAQVLLHFGDYIDWFGHVKTVGSYPQRLINRRQVTLSKLDVHHRANNLHHATYVSVRAISVGRSHIYSVNSS